MKNLYPKLKTGAHGFVMVADYEKYNRALDNRVNLSITYALLHRRRYTPVRWAAQWLWKIAGERLSRKRLNTNEDGEPRPGRWYHASIARTCKMLRELGYEITDPDVGVNHRDPVIHFTK